MKPRRGRDETLCEGEPSLRLVWGVSITAMMGITFYPHPDQMREKGVGVIPQSHALGGV